MADLASLPHDATLAYRRGGGSDLWKTVAHRSLYRVCNHGHLLIIAQALDSFHEVAPPPGVRISELTSSDWSALETIVTRRELTGFARRLAAGMVGLIAWRGERPAGYTWLTRQMLPFVTPCPVVLPPHAAYLFDLYVIPGERSGGIGSALASARLALARAQGFTEGWRMVAPTNAASWRTVEKTAGGQARVVGEIRYVRVFNRVLSWSA
jgi:ribosomal protein S18 acetylase RimI-like enzyme